MMIAFCFAALVLGTVVCIAAGKRRVWICHAAYSAGLVGSIIIAPKIVPIVDGVFVSASVGLYSMTFLITDYLGEVHGRPVALQSVLMGLIAAPIVIFATQFALVVEPAPFWAENQPSMQVIFGSAPRILAASLLAFLSAQLVDVTLFDRLKQASNGRLLLVRNNVSTIVGQTIDSIVFYTVAFLGVIPNILELIIVTSLVKYAIAFADTPSLYLARACALRSHEPAGEEAHD